MIFSERFSLSARIPNSSNTCLFESIIKSFESEKKFKKDSTQYWTEFFQTKSDQDEPQETIIKGLMK